MEALVSHSPDTDALALLEPWVAASDADTAMHAAVAMSHVPGGLWPECNAKSPAQASSHFNCAPQDGV